MYSCKPPKKGSAAAHLRREKWNAAKRYAVVAIYCEATKKKCMPSTRDLRIVDDKGNTYLVAKSAESKSRRAGMSRITQQHMQDRQAAEGRLLTQASHDNTAAALHMLQATKPEEVAKIDPALVPEGWGTSDIHADADGGFYSSHIEEHGDGEQSCA